MPHNPSDEPAGHRSVTRIEVNQTHEEILEYWTKERMAEATPRELPEPGPPPREQD
ncbi:MAG: hypothetical protein ABWY04_09115 [Arthrobacter sp.]